MDKSNKKQTVNKNLKQDNIGGLDPDEQAMNGLYGPPETEYEDRLHDSKNKP